jgi:hypothetical protein
VEGIVTQVMVQTTFPQEVVIECTCAAECQGTCLLPVNHGDRCAARNQKHRWQIATDPSQIRELFDEPADVEDETRL